MGFINACCLIVAWFLIVMVSGVFLVNWIFLFFFLRNCPENISKGVLEMVLGLLGKWPPRQKDKRGDGRGGKYSAKKAGGESKQEMKELATARRQTRKIWPIAARKVLGDCRLPRNFLKFPEDPSVAFSSGRLLFFFFSSSNAYRNRVFP